MGIALDGLCASNTPSCWCHVQEERLYAAFKAMDVDNKGYLTLSDVAKVSATRCCCLALPV